MISYLPALGLVGCLALALRGVALVRDVGPVGRLEPSASEASDQRSGGPLLTLLDAIASRLEAPVAQALGPVRLERVNHRLSAAGRPHGMTARAYAGRRAALAVALGGVGILLVLGSGNPLWSFLYAVAGWVGPDTWLAGKARRRQARIDRDLPDFLDVLAVSVSAGVGFRPALHRVSESMGGPVAEEMLTTLHQIELGSGRREAFDVLRSRNDSEFLAQFVTAVLQAEELGVPLRDAMLDLAQEMRRSAHQRARSRAQRAGPRVSLIVTTLIVPAAMLLILSALFASGGGGIGEALGR